MNSLMAWHGFGRACRSWQRQHAMPSLRRWPLFLAAVGWEVWVRLKDVPTYILPAPSKVLGRLLGDLPFFAGEGAVTVSEALAGFALGSAVALIGATLMAHSRFLERSLLPLAILVKVMPIVAIAPLFVIWFGFGSAPKILIAALLTFFPVLVGGVAGFRSVDPRAADFLRSLKASRREVFLTLRVPSAMPYLFAGFRVSVPLAVIGAVIAEWFTGDRGLGSVIIVAHSNLDMPTPLLRDLYPRLHGDRPDANRVADRKEGALLARVVPHGLTTRSRNYLKKAYALFPPTRPQGLGSWGHIPQTPCQRS